MPRPHLLHSQTHEFAERQNVRLHPKASNQQQCTVRSIARTTHDAPFFDSTHSLGHSLGAAVCEGFVHGERGRACGRSMLRSRAGNGMLPLLLTVLCAGCGALVQPNQLGIPAAGLRLPLRTGVPSSDVLSTKVTASVRLLRVPICLDGCNCNCMCVYCIHTK